MVGKLDKSCYAWCIIMGTNSTILWDNMVLVKYFFLIENVKWCYHIRWDMVGSYVEVQFVFSWWQILDHGTISTIQLLMNCKILYVHH